MELCEYDHPNRLNRPVYSSKIPKTCINKFAGNSLSFALGYTKKWAISIYILNKSYLLMENGVRTTCFSRVLYWIVSFPGV